MITIAVINESPISDAEIQKMLPAFETQWNRDLRPAWALEESKFTLVSKADLVPPGAWWLVWLNDSDQADALAYHDVTDEGLPLSKVFVKTIQGDNASLSVAATHEICEMAVDPTLNLAAQDQAGTFWAYEIADPVESDQYGYEIDGILVTDFVLPSWFGFKSSQAPFDFKHHCTDAFQVLAGGYAQKFTQDGWMQVTKRANSHRANHPSEGSRRERRSRGHARWNRSRQRSAHR
ncbi:MAG TPA: hypothetical protein VFK02_14635 [Kofleriaceae bacterium]|nr:hypothetical protein [Kofleriaceae bacterium]